MTLREWLDRYGKGGRARLMRESGISGPTIDKAAQGEPVGRYDTAKRISEATAGLVTVAELCEPESGEAA
jgi:hypothetical protein